MFQGTQSPCQAPNQRSRLRSAPRSRRGGRRVRRGPPSRGPVRCRHRIRVMKSDSASVDLTVPAASASRRIGTAGSSSAAGIGWPSTADITSRCRPAQLPSWSSVGADTPVGGKIDDSAQVPGLDGQSRIGDLGAAQLGEGERRTVSGEHLEDEDAVGAHPPQPDANPDLPPEHLLEVLLDPAVLGLEAVHREHLADTGTQQTGRQSLYLVGPTSGARPGHDSPPARRVDRHEEPGPSSARQHPPGVGAGLGPGGRHTPDRERVLGARPEERRCISPALPTTPGRGDLPLHVGHPPPPRPNGRPTTILSEHLAHVGGASPPRWLAASGRRAPARCSSVHVASASSRDSRGASFVSADRTFLIRSPPTSDRNLG